MGHLGQHPWSLAVLVLQDLARFCLAAPGHIYFGNTFVYGPDKSGRATNHLKIPRHLSRTQFIKPQPLKSLVSSDHFFQLRGLRDYCELF